jgi:hypothetical protein
MQSAAMHSNVRMSESGVPDTISVNNIGPSRSVQDGRSIEEGLGSREMSGHGMMLPFVLRRERDARSHLNVHANGDGRPT